MRVDLLEKNFKNQHVKVGVPHWDKPGELFFYYGWLAEVTEKDIVLFSNKQMIKVDLDIISEIKVVEKNERNDFY